MEDCPQAMVAAFHRTFGAACPSSPTGIPAETRDLRLRLMLEELLEFSQASGAGSEVVEALQRADRSAAAEAPSHKPADLVGVADALADLLYVVYGTAVAYGIDIAPIFREVHASNMTKTDGGTRADGKVQKGPHYRPPAIAPLLAAQARRS